MVDQNAPTSLEVAKIWLRMGGAPIPVPHRSKNPGFDGWQHLILSEGQLPKHFNGDPQNIGLLLGDPSNGIVDVDLDVSEAIAAGRILLPETFTFGRKSKPESHKLYYAPGLKTRKFAYDGMLVELRSTGAQTIVPRSTHESGEIIHTQSATNIPIRVTQDPAELEQDVELVAMAAMAARVWGKDRHHMALHLTGTLFHGGMGWSRIKRLMEAIVHITKDPEAHDRLTAVSDTLMAAEQGEPITGLPALAEQVPELFIKNLRKWGHLDEGHFGLVFDSPQASPEPSGWGEEMPLYRDAGAAEICPVDAVEGPLLEGVEAMTQIIKAPVALAVQSVLGGASLAVQGYADVAIEGLRHPTSEFFVSVSDSGERKTTTDDAAVAPHRSWRKSRMEAYRDASTQYKQDLRMWKRREAKEDDPGPEPIAPRNPILTMQEPSYEGLVKLLEEAWPSLGLFSSEGGQFLHGYAMSPENRRRTIGGLNDAWDGKEISRVRVGESTLLFGRRLCMHLMVQPRVADSLLADVEAQELGFLARCLITRPDTTMGTRLFERANLENHTGYQRYQARIREVLERPLPMNEQTGELAPRVVRPDPEAYEIWVGYHDHVEKQLLTSLSDVKAAAAKSAQHALRLAGILALVDDMNCQAIGANHMSCGIKLAMYFLEEAQRLTGAAEIGVDLYQAKELGLWMQAREQPIKVREMCQFGPNAMRTRGAIHKALLILQQHGWTRKAGERPEQWEVRKDVPVC